jgi:hypothetical protein
MNTTTKNRPIYSVESCDKDADFPSINQKWKEMFGEPLDTDKAVSVEDRGDCITYLMPNGYKAEYACDGESIYAPERAPTEDFTGWCDTCERELIGICEHYEESRALAEAEVLNNNNQHSAKG